MTRLLWWQQLQQQRQKMKKKSPDSTKTMSREDEDQDATEWFTKEMLENCINSDGTNSMRKRCKAAATIAMARMDGAAVSMMSKRRPINKVELRKNGSQRNLYFVWMKNIFFFCCCCCAFVCVSEIAHAGKIICRCRSKSFAEIA